MFPLFPQENFADKLSRGGWAPATAALSLKRWLQSNAEDVNAPNSAGLRPLQALLLQTQDLEAFQVLVQYGARVTPEILEFAKTRYPHYQNVHKLLDMEALRQSLPTKFEAPQTKVKKGAV